MIQFTNREREGGGEREREGLSVDYTRLHNMTHASWPNITSKITRNTTQSPFSCYSITVGGIIMIRHQY